MAVHALALLLVVALTVSSVRVLHARDASRARAAHDAAVGQAVSVTQRTLAEPIADLQQVARTAAVGPVPSPARWRAYVTRAWLRPALFGVSFIARVPEAGRSAFERRTGHPIVVATSAGPLPAPHRGTHLVVAAYVNRQGGQRALGTDVGVDPQRAAAAARAARTGRPAATAVVPLLDDARHRSAVLIYIPVVTGGRVRGFASGLYETTRLQASVLRALPRGTRLALALDGRRFAGPDLPGASRRTVALADRTVTLSIAPPATGTPAVSLVALLGGFVLTLVVALAFFLDARRERYALALVARRLHERQAVEAQLRRERDYSSTIVDAIQEGFVVMHEGLILRVNDRFCAMTGFSREELLGAEAPLPFWPPEEHEHIAERFARALEVGHAEEELVLMRRDGTRFAALIASGTAMTVDGQVLGHIATVRDISERKAHEQMLAELAARDALTGLLNHRSFHEHLAAEVARARRYRRPVALVLLDLDHFKAVNDALGHPVGDRVLAETAARLEGLARAGEWVARIGGEEFAWILPDTDGVSAFAAAERARQAIAAAPFGEAGSLTMSVGVCDLAEAGSADELHRLADVALYWAKAHGRDSVFRYSAAVAGELGAGESPTERERQQTIRTLHQLACVVEAKDVMSTGHTDRVAALAHELALAAGWPADRAARLREAALLHDVGKVAVRADVLSKPGRLDPEELEHVRSHVVIGTRMIASVLDPEQVAWVRQHHERPDGRGYPDGLRGEQISDGGGLLAMADAWDAMTSPRAYKQATPLDTALTEAAELTGRQFAADAVSLLSHVIDASRRSRGPRSAQPS